ncbi:5-oxoprolinase subunit PxpA [Lunatibacter salilacus]|uniref:5-oxoprolinase subunit PxpA n=1 Tax=Lunatibacter salilacus TaxID=2483804 RepID=UPI00131BD417|nr:5-oxoprolinase subunit PxpA [Lunatibacter salilacus]
MHELKKNFLDINADLGEQTGNDAGIMPYISSCNIACGGHAGGRDSIRYTIDLALTHAVKIGAHPSYPDRENFGRKHMDISKEDLSENILWQICQIQSYLNELKIPLHHIKFHGALYNEAATDTNLAFLIVDLLKHHFPTILIYAPFGSKLAILAAAEGIPVKHEVFADRRYQDDLTLVPRSSPDACIEDWGEIKRQVEEMVYRQRVKSINGNWLPIQADTLCVHGDHPGAIETAKKLHQLLSNSEMPGL